MQGDSLKKRFLFKLATNIVGFTISILTAGLVPRALGVDGYGNYTFLYTILMQFLLFIEIKSSTWFFKRVSQNNDAKENFVFYGYLISAFIIILFLVIGFLYFFNFSNMVFLKQPISYVILAAVVVFVSWLQSVFSQMMDAYGQTVWLEKMQIVFRIVSILLLVSIIYFNGLSIVKYFVFQFFVALSQILVIYFYLKKYKDIIFIARIRFEEFKKQFRAFYVYCAPLALYQLVGTIYLLADRWMLQFFGGANQQGLFSFSLLFTNVCVIFTTAMMPLLMREMSIYAENKDTAKMSLLFRNQVPMLYAITAFFCCFLFTQAENLIGIFGGAKYANAVPIFLIYIFYPLVYTYGNLHSTVFYSSGRTNVYLYLSLIMTPLSLVATYILVGDNKYVGMNLGGRGLALKEIVMGGINCIVYLTVNARFLKLNFIKHFLHLICSPFIFVAIGLASHYCVSIYSIERVQINFIVSGVFYTLLVVILVAFVPRVFGLKKHQINDFYLIIKSKFTKA